MTRKQKTVSKVLELKGFTREQLEAEVKKALQAFHHEQEKLEHLEQELKTHSKDFCSKQDQGCMNAREMDIYYTYGEHLHRQIEVQQKCALVRQTQLEEIQQSMVAAYQDERLMEILHEKIVVQEARAAGQGEQKEADFRFLVRRMGK
jgi:flagellar export protein FliJ